MHPDSVKSVNVVNPNSYLASGNRAPSVNPNSNPNLRVRVRVGVNPYVDKCNCLVKYIHVYTYT